MTNGEKFKEVFQISQTDEGILYAFAWLPNHDAAEFSIDWWNAEYKDCEHCAKTYGTLGCCDTVSNKWVYSCKEGHEEYARGMRKFGSTTKNDLGVDCISRDDAIEVLKDWDGYFIGHSSDDVIKALNLAIKALEHPEKNIVAVVPCGDAVSRAEVLKLMKDNWHTHDGDWAMQESMDDIRALPSVTPQEPRKGHWMDKSHLFESCSAECSSCHKRSNGYLHDNGFSLECKYYDFCPNCGAKMVGPQESEEQE